MSSLLTFGSPEPTSRPGADYVAALQVANTFLHAWIERDAGSGLQLMSPHLLSPSAGDEPAESHRSWLNQYLRGLSNPHHSAFEIAQGRAHGQKRWSFPVVLYEWADGQPTADAYSSSIELIRAGDRWLVDRIPKSSDSIK